MVSLFVQPPESRRASELPEEKEWKSADSVKRVGAAIPSQGTVVPEKKVIETKQDSKLQPTSHPVTDAKVDAKTDSKVPPPQSRPPEGVDLGEPLEAPVRFSWVNPKIQARVCKTGTGVYAMEDVPKDETLIVWTGKILSAEEALYIMETEDRHYILQIGDRFYQTPLTQHREAADWTNHSCEPNAGFGKGSPVCLSAMRDIKAGEQICFDYAMCETDPRLWDPMDVSQ